MMDYRELMSNAPEGLQPTVVDNNKGYSEELEKKAKSLGKKVSELTEEEKEDARETFMAGHGLCDLDMMIP